MDRTEFSNSIDDITSEDIINSFDSIMALYNIVNDYDYKNIKISKQPDEIASFDIAFTKKESVQSVIELCNGMIVDIYDQKVNIKCIENKNSIHIIFF